MQCSDAREFVSAFIDGEMAGEVPHGAAAHIETCPSCKKLADDYRTIGRQVASGYVHPPLDLAAKLRMRMRIAAEADVMPSAAPRRRTFMLQAAALLLACALSALASWYVTRQTETRDRLQSEVVATHVRSLMQDKPVQIASSERHTVKPWFAGRIDFSPNVKDLGAQGFPLVGARVDYVGGRRVAVLVYMRRLHMINVFMWPSIGTGAAEPQTSTFNGYNGVTWTANHMTQWAVSDLNLRELKELQALLMP